MPGFDAPLTIETSVDLAWLGLAWPKGSGARTRTIVCEC